MRPDHASKKIHAGNTAVCSNSCTGTPMINPGRRAVSIYENEIPEFVESALERIYCNIYCTLRRIGLYDSLAGVSTYVAVDDVGVETVILYRIVGRTIYVLNQQIQLRTDQMMAFSDAIFARYRMAARIEFYALDATIVPARDGFPYHVVPRLEEQVVELPDTEELYVRSPGARSIRKYLKVLCKLRAEHPTYRCDVLRGEEIEMAHIREIVGLADKRMHSKNRSSYIEASQMDRFAELARTHGILGLIYINDEIHAGVLGYIAGNRCFVQLVGHDPEWNSYALGNIAQLQMILFCIREGIKEVLMMGGGDDAKARFLAHRKILYSITVYRPGSILSCNWKRYLRNETKIMVHACKEVIKHKTTESGILAKTLARLVLAVRTTRMAKRRVQWIVSRPSQRLRCQPGQPDASAGS